ncbi:MAG: uroporphyrinogen decarboxylase family protein [Chloroflexi bacterium]|nr:uroporphyrinogen decarboxylase family protein [Chloroflexota bacterium]
MAVYTVDIRYPSEWMEASQRRMMALREFRYVDRVPVVLGVYTRYLLKQRSVGYEEYLSSPRAHLIHQLENYKWLLEHVREDRCISGEITLQPDFENIPNAGAFGAHIGYQDDQPPRALPFIRTIDEMEALPEARPQDGTWGTCIAWVHEWRKLLQEDIRVRFNGKPVAVHASTGMYGLGPFSTAIDLAGERLYEWLYEAPAACHRFLAKITHALVNMELYCRENIDPTRRGGIGLAEDSAQIISAAQFREFVLPYCRTLYEAFPGDRSMHMCGSSGHLLPILRDELHITHFSGFGSVVNPAYVGSMLGGKVQLLGNVDCWLLQQGPADEINRAAAHCLETLAPYGGYTLSDGCNVTPSTPLEHLNLMMAASEAYGLPVKHHNQN